MKISICIPQFNRIEYLIKSLDMIQNQSYEDFEVVILDPPRAGAGLEVITEIDRIARRAVVYVACEPSALGRDAKYLADAGWSMTQLVGLDAFPMTGHVECIALFERF